jgi:hypothetical protein
MDEAFTLFGVLLAVGGAGTITYAAITITTALTERFRGKRAVVGADDLDEIRARLEATEALEARVMELEERVDFAERLLAQPRDQADLPAHEPGHG